MNNLLNKFVALWAETGREPGIEELPVRPDSDSMHTREPSRAKESKDLDSDNSSGHGREACSARPNSDDRQGRQPLSVMESKSPYANNRSGHDASQTSHESEEEEIWHGLGNPWGNTHTQLPNWPSKVAQRTVSYDELPIRFRFDPIKYSPMPPGILSKTARSPLSRDLTGQRRAVSMRRRSRYGYLGASNSVSNVSDGARYSGVASKSRQQTCPARESPIDREHRLSLAIEKEEIAAAKYICPPNRWRFRAGYYETLANMRAVAAAESGSSIIPSRQKSKKPRTSRNLRAGFMFEEAPPLNLTGKKRDNLPPVSFPDWYDTSTDATDALNEKIQQAALREEKELEEMRENSKKRIAEM